MPPSRFAGYLLEGELGRGGVGVVYAARRASDGLPVALKVLDPASVDERALARLADEARAALRLRDEGIVQTLDVGVEAGRPYLVLERVDGGTLADRLAREGPLPPAEAGALLAAVARAVGRLHAAGVVHRDLKPGNVLLRRDGRPVVADLGLAKLADLERTATRSGTLLGTPAYMAPEQANGDLARVGPASDVWALGGTLCAALTGAPPFEAPTVLETLRLVVEGDPVPPSRRWPRRHDGALARALEAVALRCLARDPARRYADGAALAAALEGALEAPARAARARRRRRGVLALSAALTAGLGPWSLRAAATTAADLAAAEAAAAAPAAEAGVALVDRLEALAAAADARGLAAAVLAGPAPDPRDGPVDLAAVEALPLVPACATLPPGLRLRAGQAAARGGALAAGLALLARVAPPSDASLLPRHALALELRPDLATRDVPALAAARSAPPGPTTATTRALARAMGALGAIVERAQGRELDPAAASVAAQDVAAVEGRLAPAHHHLARAACRVLQRDPAGVLADAEAALALTPGSLAAGLLRGEALLLLGRLEEGIEEHDRVLAARPGLPRAAQHRAIALMNLGRLDEARAGLEALGPEPNRETAEALCFLYAQQGDLPRAVAMLDRAIALAPGRGDLRAQRGTFAFVSGDAARALAEFEAARAAGHDTVRDGVYRALALFRLGRLDEGIAAARALVETPEGRAEPVLWRELGVALARRRASEEAEAAFAQAVALSPDAAAIRISLVELRWQTGRHAEALAAVEAAPPGQVARSAGLAARAGLCCLELGRPADAARWADLALAGEAGESIDRLRRAMLLEDLGRLDEARRDYAALVRPDRAPPQALAGLARLARVRGDLAGAHHLLDRSIAAAPEHPALLAEAVELHLAERAPGRALAAARRLAEVAPDVPQAAGALARALEANGDVAGATAALRAALARLRAGVPGFAELARRLARLEGEPAREVERP